MSTFRGDPLADFECEVEALEAEGLLAVDGTAMVPTPRGMFYADSIVGLFAWRQVRRRRSHWTEQAQLPAKFGETSNAPGYM